ncbi:MAG: hypothetical protein LKF34_03645 [Acidaminococcaceae bacterium]|nr:hypothetical protein [Acidaminococcaceae bacterium]
MLFNIRQPGQIKLIGGAGLDYIINIIEFSVKSANLSSYGGGIFGRIVQLRSNLFRGLGNYHVQVRDRHYFEHAGYDSLFQLLFLNLDIGTRSHSSGHFLRALIKLITIMATAHAVAAHGMTALTTAHQTA